MIANTEFYQLFHNPVRMVMGRVELYLGDTLTQVCGCHDRLKEFTVERISEGKFFGYGVCHKLNVKLLDKDRELNITTANSIEIEFGLETQYIYPFPRFYVSEVHRDELTNELSITAYDALYKANTLTVADLNIVAPYTIMQFTNACAAALGVPVMGFMSGSGSNGAIGGSSSSGGFSYDGREFNTQYLEGANFEGTETIREALNAIAEATQTIYFLNRNWELQFVRFSNQAATVYGISKPNYFTLDSGDNRRLAKIVHATELGDNVSAATGETGTTQYVRNNPFWDLRSDIDTLVNNAVAAVGGLTINQFNCEWRGNPLLQIGDKISIRTKDDNLITTYFVNDTLTYDGTLKQNTSWQFENNEEETAENPTSLGDALRQTYARVDKANKQVEIVVSDIAAANEKISKIEANVGDITLSVSEVDKKVEDNAGDITTLKSNVSNLQLTANNISLSVSEVDKKTEDNKSAIETNAGAIKTINTNMAELQITANNISASVSTIEETLTTATGELNDEVQTLKSSVEAQITADDVVIEVKKELENGVDKVITSTGFTFNEEGLTVSKSGAEMETTITEDGMTVYRNSEEVLVANHNGVDAVNLHATTYLIVGGYSRFENYGARTGCFWIGG